MCDPKEAEEAKLLAWLPYMSLFLGLIPLLMFKGNSFAKHHFGQGLILFGLRLLVAFLYIIPLLFVFFGYMAALFFAVASGEEGTATTLLAFFTAGLQMMSFGGIFVLFIGFGIILAIAITGIVKAATGECWVIPVVGKLAVKMGLSQDPAAS